MFVYKTLVNIILYFNIFIKNFRMETKQQIFLLLSGKRKSGKDYLANKLLEKIGIHRAEIIHISEPIKLHWAKLKKLDLNELLSDGPYKEMYRKEMIEWSDQIRQENSGFFCEEAMKTVTKSIIIVSDIRRRTDIKYFNNLYQQNCVTIRIETNTEIRKNRGFAFQIGIDDVPSECDLDDYNSWNLKLQNNNCNDVDIIIKEIFTYCKNNFDIVLFKNNDTL